MTKDPIAKTIAAMIVQLDLAISARLVDNPHTLDLFEAYGDLLDALYAGLNGGSRPAGYDELVYANLEQAQVALANLGVMGRSLPDPGLPDAVLTMTLA